MSLARRILAFAGLPFLSLVTPFLFLPILARVAGLDAWLAVAVGQSIGAFAALFVALGYNTIGPTAVALEPAATRSVVLERSIRPRLAVLVPVVAFAAAAAAVAAPASFRLEAALMAIALTLSGLSAGWYMVGLGRAGLIVVYELVPRIVATSIAALALLWLSEVVWYPVLLIAVSLFGSGVFVLRTMGVRALFAPAPGAVRRQFVENRVALTTEIAAGAYNSLSVTFVSLAAPAAQAASFVSGDKLYRIGQYSVSALGNALQGWVVEDQREHFRQRARASLTLHLVLGILGMLAFVLVGPWLSGFLFGDVVAIDAATALGLGFATLGISMGTALGRVLLIGLGARREFMISVIGGAVVGVPAVIALASLFGAAGGAWGLAIGELVSVALQSTFAILRWPPSRGADSQPHDP